MTSKPYTYTKLIDGHTCARNASKYVLDNLRHRLTAEEIRRHSSLIDYLNDEIRRCSLLRLVCGDVCVIVR